MTMDTTIDQQVAMDEALVPHAQRLRIGRSNFHLLSDIKSKESALQLVYDVLRICPFFKAFLVTADVPEIYMQEFWATAIVYHHAIRFKMDNKKHIMNLESFRDMLHICPRVAGQSFAEPSFEEEILAFICFLGHSAAIRNLIDVNINKLYQPWRSFGLYHKRNVDYAYLMWEDFVYQIEHKNSKKSNEMYYPRFTKVIIDHFMSKDPSIPRRNKFGALLPIELKNEDIKNSNAYKEYYVITTGAAPPKPKASIRKTRSSSDTSITPSTVAAGDDNEGKDGDSDEEDDGDDGEEGEGDDDDVEDDGDEGDDDDDQEVEMDDDKDDEEEGRNDDQEYDEDEYDEETMDEESFDHIPKTPENSDDEGNGEENIDLNIGGEERNVEEEEEDELYRDVNINQGRGIQATLEVEDSHVTLTPINPDGQQQSSSTPTLVAPLPMSAPTMTPSTIATITTTSQAPILLTTAPSTIIQDLPNFGSLFGFDNRLRTLEANFSEFMQTNQFAEAVSSDHLHDEAQRENDEFLKTVDENMQKIIKEQVKEQVKTSYAVAAGLSEMELKKILIEKMEGNKETITLKRRHDDDADKDEEPSAGPDRGSKRHREGKEPDSASALTKTATRSTGRSTQRSRSRQASSSESALAEEPMQTTFQMEEPSHPEFDTCAEDQPIVQSSQHPEWFSQQQKPPTPDHDWNKTLSAIHGSIQRWIRKLAKQTDSRSSFNELMDTPLDFLSFLINRLKVNAKGQQYPHNLLQPLPLIPNNRGRRVIPFEHFINNDLEYLCGSATSRKYTTSITKTKATDYEHIKWIEDMVPRTMWIEEPIGYDKHALWGVSHWGRKCQQFYSFAVNQESTRDVYSKRRIIAVTELKIVEWHNYKHLDWITVRRDDDKLYKFKEGDFKRLSIQYIEDMLLLLVQGKLTNLTIEEHFAFNNKDKKNRLMRIDELHKFSDGTLTDVRTDLDDRLKGIRMQSIFTDLQVTPTKPGRMTKPYSSHHFIANCFNAGNINMEVK
nr:hypothetical protein [Tanacetum cinerariifolium]